MLTKVFLSPLFSFNIPWMKQYYQNFNALPAGWEHIIFTDLDLESSKNIAVIKMNVEQFKDLVQRKIGVMPYVPVPSPKFGDMRPAFGKIFEDYIKGADFWGHTDFDMVLGNLDKFVPESVLNNCDIFSDDINAVNGIFTLYRNNPKVNLLFTDCPNWRFIFTDTVYHAFDEAAFSQLVRGRQDIRFVDGQRHKHDRNGSSGLRMEHGRLYQFDEEIMAFHFRRTKRWPL